MLPLRNEWLAGRGLGFETDDDPRVGSNRNVSTEGGILSPSDSRISSFLPLIKPFLEIPDTFILNHCSLDGFLFLRYLKVLRILFLVGCFIACPILIPLHITGGRGLEGLDLLTIGNVRDSRMFYAHAVVVMLWFSFALLMIVRECLYYIDLRIAYVSSPFYAQQLSSRTMLLIHVPNRYRNESCLRRLFGTSVKRVWIPRTSKTLTALIKERKEVASKLEKAEIELIVKSNTAHNKGPNFHSILPLMSFSTPLAINNSTVGNYSDSSDLPVPDIGESARVPSIPKGARPHHRVWSRLGCKIDTISWARFRIKHLNTQISKSRYQLCQARESSIPAAFIEFDTQQSAHAAHQKLAHHKPRQLVRHLGIRPSDILWQSLRIGWRESITRRLFVYGFIAAAIILWSFPTAAIGVASNVEFLSENVPFLGWTRQIPQRLLRPLQGFIPALVLTLWIAVVPALLRFCAVQAGALSLSMVELFTQETYFVFLVVQVFLITSFSSAVSSMLPAFCYAGIAPVILIFAACGMVFLQMIYRYNLIYVLDCDLSSTGQFYPRALLHLVTGLYLAELCLVGIFLLKSAFVPMTFIILLVVLTAFVHFELSKAINPLLHNLPQCLWYENEDPPGRQEEDMSGNSPCNARNPGDAATMEELEDSEGEDWAEADTENEEIVSTMPSFTSRFRFSSITAGRTQAPKSGLGNFTRSFGFCNLAKQLESLRNPRWLVPDVRNERLSLHETVSSDNLQVDEYPIEGTTKGYLPPELWLPKPTLWIPRDGMGVSRQEVAQTKRYTPITDAGATLHEGGRIVTNFGEAPIDEARFGQTRWEAIESAAPSLICPSALGL
ncbi:hypothetical protein NM208_g1636 [Fusarium decemcellulare]|uniref:Uncharacterized protein n=2 Tax=Fusarium decemcellulare TaxID=57161 RepID=A0ACC1SVH4_9HYPO|nr:hypothetical protein NM208_g2080 [Fusarium decemcellulare]KAJ3547191.1 hypothetical protein NM208_g1636 [Fusarium decemcellulare]